MGRNSQQSEAGYQAEAFKRYEVEERRERLNAYRKLAHDANLSWSEKLARAIARLVA